MWGLPSIFDAPGGHDSSSSVNVPGVPRFNFELFAELIDVEALLHVSSRDKVSMFGYS